VSPQADDLRLSHFTKKPLGEIRTTEQKFDGEYRSCFDKPKGLWVSVDGEDDWQQWCNSEMPDWMEGVQRYRVQLTEKHGLLILTSGAALQDFTLRYGREREDRFRDTYIDWPTVASEYSGLIIAPYQWSCRMSEFTRWYYGWDCASGCIWNADAIARVENYQEAVAA
jgi:hypothetical protein